MDLIKIGNVLSWILLGIAILFALWYIFGNSPTLEQTLLSMFATYVIKLHFSISKMNGTLGEIRGTLNEHIRSHK